MTLDSKKIVVVGCGANGSCVASDLTMAGVDVVAFDQWPAHVSAIQENGLKIVTPDGETVAPVRAYHMCDAASLNEQFDVALIMVKAYDTRWAAEFIKPRLKPDGIAVGVQNAMTAELIREMIGPRSGVGCVLELSSEVFTPGLIQRNTPRSHTWFGVGGFGDEQAEDVDLVASILSRAGRVSVTPNILSAKWMKLVVNTMCLAPCAILGLKIYDAMKVPGSREMALRAGAEAFELGQRLGHKLEPIFGLTDEDLAGSNQVLEKLLDKLNKDVGPNARDCVLQDFLKGRESEVALINGLVASEMEQRGLEAPVNKAIADVSRRIELRQLKPDPSNLMIVNSNVH